MKKRRLITSVLCCAFVGSAFLAADAFGRKKNNNDDDDDNGRSRTVSTKPAGEVKSFRATKSLKSGQANEKDSMLGKIPPKSAKNVTILPTIKGRDPSVNRLSTNPALREKQEKIMQRANLLAATPGSIDQRDDSGNTLMHWAVGYRLDVTAKQLLSKGADPFLKNRKGLTAYDMAKKTNQAELIELFELQKAMTTGEDLP